MSSENPFCGKELIEQLRKMYFFWADLAGLIADSRHSGHLAAFADSTAEGIIQNKFLDVVSARKVCEHYKPALDPKQQREVELRLNFITSLMKVCVNTLATHQIEINFEPYVCGGSQNCYDV